MAQSVNLWGATYSDVPAIEVPKSGGGTASFTDVTDTTAAASDVATGKYFYTAAGVRTQGTGSGGSGSVVVTDVPNATGTGASVSADDVTTLITKSITQNGTYNASSDSADGYSSVTVNVSGGSPSATQHTIHLEFSDSTDTDIPVYYNDSVLGTMITAYEPSVWTYSNKTVTLAQLDGVTWYEPAPIPLNTQLIDYTAVKGGYYIDGSDGAEHSQQWACCSDFTKIDPSMTFSFVAYQWFDMAFYDSSKTYISGVKQSVYADTIENDYAHGTLSGARIPSNAVYVRFSSYPNAGISSTQLSLIRTA